MSVLERICKKNNRTEWSDMEVLKAQYLKQLGWSIRKVAKTIGRSYTATYNKIWKEDY